MPALCSCVVENFPISHLLDPNERNRARVSLLVVTGSLSFCDNSRPQPTGACSPAPALCSPGGSWLELGSSSIILELERAFLPANLAQYLKLAPAVLSIWSPVDKSRGCRVLSGGREPTQPEWIEDCCDGHLGYFSPPPTLSFLSFFFFLLFGTIST